MSSVSEILKTISVIRNEVNTFKSFESSEQDNKVDVQNGIIERIEDMNSVLGKEIKALKDKTNCVKQ